MQSRNVFQALELSISPALWIPASFSLPDTNSAVRAIPESPAASDWSLSAPKRMMDIGVALLVLIVFALPMLAIAVLVRATSPGVAIFTQKRVGRGGRLFTIYKFRTMDSSVGQPSGPGLTQDGDSRVTSLGRILRRLKLDELPQFYNILRGDMSLIGPRPKLPKYAAIHNPPYRPGITGAATLAFRREEELLRHVHPELLEDFYNLNIRPLKANLDLNYMACATFLSDLQMIAATLFACVFPDTVPVVTMRGAAPEKLTAQFDGD